MNEKGLGVRLQAARQKAGLTQQQMCQKANLSYSTLAKIERGAIKAPSIFTIQSIAGALDSSLDELVGASSPARPARQTRRTAGGASFIYFDVNGCLVRFHQNAFNQIAADYGLTPDVVEMAYLHYNDDACKGILTLDDFNNAMAQRLGLESLDWASYYLNAAQPVEAMHKLMAWVSQTYRFGLLTNIMPGLLLGLKAAGKVPDLRYDAVLDSSELGVIKPDPRIFEIAAEQADVPVSELLLIDDTQGNLSAAEKLGWQVIRFDYAQPEASTARIREALEPAA